MSEHDLYRPVHDYLEQRFRDRIKPPFGEIRSISKVIANTTGGAAAGLWSRPDLCLVAFWRYKYGINWHFSLHSFEVKTKVGCDRRAVYEALSHASMVNYTHLVWHNPAWDPSDQQCGDMHERCMSHGVGLITIGNPANVDTFSIRVPARYHETSGDAVDEFLETRLDSEDREQLLEWINEMRRTLR
jgi:hypothetical protein